MKFVLAPMGAERERGEKKKTLLIVDFHTAHPSRLGVLVLRGPPSGGDFLDLKKKSIFCMFQNF